MDVRPVTRDNWHDFERLFSARGAPHYCWCMPYRLRGSPDLDSAERKAGMRALVDAGTPIGVLAYHDGAPVGWCSVAPRETYVRLERSRVMPRVPPPSTPTWTILCLFVARPHRGAGVARALLDGAVAYARSQGAREVEGYPYDAAGITATHHGHSSIFAAAGFRGDGRRWSRRVK